MASGSGNARLPLGRASAMSELSGAVDDQPALSFTDGFAGDVLGAIALEHALRRLIAFASSPRSGFLAYDLAGHAARTSGRLDEVGPWTLLLADALAGRVAVGDVDGFIRNLDAFVDLLLEVPDIDLAAMDDDQLARVIKLCTFGFPGVWAPKVTKVAALYRPRAVPVLDGYMALAFGYAREGFSYGVKRRHRAIDAVVRALAMRTRAQAPVLAKLRHTAQAMVPEIRTVSEIRLVDTIIWTSQDDRMKRHGKRLDAWLTSEPIEPPRLDQVKWLSATGVNQDQGAPQ
jgi:hypothetical protein